MNSKKIISTIIAFSLMSSGLALAQGRGNRDDRGRSEQWQRGNQNDDRDNDRRQSDRRGAQDRDHGRAGGDNRRDERGAGPNHQFYRGQRLPVEYRHRNYVVDDWRGYQLSAPPRGYHWVQTGGDFVLVAIATGIILQVLLGN